MREQEPRKILEPLVRNERLARRLERNLLEKLLLALELDLVGEPAGQLFLSQIENGPLHNPRLVIHVPKTFKQLLVGDENDVVAILPAPRGQKALAGQFLLARGVKVEGMLGFAVLYDVFHLTLPRALIYHSERTLLLPVNATLLVLLDNGPGAHQGAAALLILAREVQLGVEVLQNKAPGRG